MGSVVSIERAMIDDLNRHIGSLLGVIDRLIVHYRLRETVSDDTLGVLERSGADKEFAQRRDFLLAVSAIKGRRLRVGV